MDFTEWMDLVSKAIDAGGVAVIVGGIVLASRVWLAKGTFDDRFRSYRRGIGRAILLELEFLAAADIIRTVAVTPTLSGVGVLAVIVLIRTFLSFTLELEIEGRWPWQRREQPGTTR